MRDRPVRPLRRRPGFPRRYLPTFLVLPVTWLYTSGCAEVTDPPDDASDPEPIEVTISPEEVFVMEKDTRGLTVEHNTGLSVRWSSANVNVATAHVTTGVVTGVKEGETTVTASLMDGGNVVASAWVPVTVTRPAIVGAIEDPATQAPVDPDTVFGTVRVRGTVTGVPLDYAATVRLEALRDDTVFHTAECTTTGTTVREAVCTWNTAVFDTVTGAVHFPNGPADVRLGLRGAQDTLLTAWSSAAKLANTSYFTTALEAEKTQLLPPGFVWTTGDVTINLLPVDYGGRNVTTLRLTAGLLDQGLGLGVPREYTRTNAPFRVTFPAALNKDIESTVTLDATFWTDTGQMLSLLPLPGSALSQFGYDALAPRIQLASQPPVLSYSAEPVVVLLFDTGPHPAGSAIALRRTAGGFVMAAHPPFCAYTHLHGDITIDGVGPPYQDPWTDPARNFEPCGHGQVLGWVWANVPISIAGVVEDALFKSTTISLRRFEGPCGSGSPNPLLEAGTTAGATPVPLYNLDAPGFDLSFPVYTGGAPLSADLCLEVEAEDLFGTRTVLGLNLVIGALGPPPPPSPPPQIP